MSGVAGRSGRKSIRDEEKRLRIIDMAWDLCEERMKSPSADRYDVAKGIVYKDITQRIEGHGLGQETKILIIRPEKKEVDASQETNNLRTLQPSNI